MKQKTALDILQQGKNVFLTGQAGSGKTYVLNQYIHWLRSHSIEPAITASTGIAATHINGTTIHSWSGMGIANELTPELRSQLADVAALRRRFRKTQVLIIDEISMIAPQFLDGVDQLCRDAREAHDKAFGGMQVIFSGDFFQLPPIVRQEDSKNVPGKRYAWQSQAWLDAQIVPCYIAEQHRQHEDDALLRLLRAIRSGDIADGTLEDLRERFDAVIDDSLEPTRLYTHNEDVDRINEEALHKIEGASVFYEMEAHGTKHGVEALQKGCLAPEGLELREGARVMFVQNNYEKGYVNGSLGTVVGWDAETGYPQVELYSGGIVTATPGEWAREKDGKVIASLRQIPLRLAWAMTVHKSQGMSLDAAEIDLSKCFEVGQGYVALSRVRSMDGLSLRGFNATAAQVDPLTIKVDKRFAELSCEEEERQEKLSPAEKKERVMEWICVCGGTVEEIDYVAQKNAPKETTHEKTAKLLAEGKSLEEIARARSIAVGTVVGHIFEMKHRGEKVITTHLEVDADLVQTVREAYDDLASKGADGELYTEDGKIRLKPLYSTLDEKVSYDDIKRALVKIL